MKGATSTSCCAVPAWLLSPRMRFATWRRPYGSPPFPSSWEARDWARLPESFHEEIERTHIVMLAGT